MSDEKETTPSNATPAWMQSQPPKAESTPPTSKRKRRTKAQMAEARAAKLGTESIIPQSEVEEIADDTVRLRDAVDVRYPSRSYMPTMISTAALVLSILSLVVALTR